MSGWQLIHPDRKGTQMKTTLILASLLVSSSVLANDIDPFGFEKQVFVGTMSRVEVDADARVALAQGRIPSGEKGMSFADTPSTRSRAQIAAETREASRLGLLTTYGSAGRIAPTSEQERQIQLAGERALGRVVAEQ
jgi:hypothetical protein